MWLASRRRSPSSLVWGAVVVVIVVVAANTWKFSLGFDSDPILHRASLSSVEAGGLLPGEHTIDPNDGFTLQALALEAGDQWLDGDVPYWNHYEGVGAPLAGEMQSMALHPFVLVHQLPNGFLLSQILMESIAGVATMLLLRRLGVGAVVATGAGIAYAFNGTFAWLSNAAASPVAYLPLLLLGTEMARDAADRARRGGWVLVAIAIAGSLYAGFPETAYISGLFVCLWCLARSRGLGRAGTIRFGRKLVAGATAGVLLAAPVLIAFLDYLPEANVGGHEGAFATAHLPTTSISALFLPYVFGPIFGFTGNTSSPNLAGFWGSVGGYLSAAQLVLALAAIGLRRWRTLQVVIAVWFVVFLSKTYGFSPVITVFNLLPGIKEMAFYRYSPPSVAMGLVVLAALGAQRLLDERLGRRFVAAVFGGAALVMVAATVYSHAETKYFVLAAHYRVYVFGSLLFALAGIGVLALVALVPRLPHRSLVLAAALAVDAAVLFVVPQLSTERMGPVNTAPVEFLRDNLGLQRFYTLGPIAPNYGSSFGIASINQNNLPVPKTWSDYVLARLDANTDPLVFTGTFRANPAGPSVLDELFRNVAGYEETATRYVVTFADPALTEIIEAAGMPLVFDDGRVTIFELPGARPYFETLDASCTVTGLSWQSVDVDCPNATTLVRRELADDGWSATVDGADAAVTTTNEIFQAVQVPAGRSRVTFEFAPTHIGLAWLLALLSIIWMVGATVLERWRRPAPAAATTTVDIGLDGDTDGDADAAGEAVEPADSGLS